MICQQHDEGLVADGKGAIVEFKTVKEASNAKENLNGVEYGDVKLSVDWPTDYIALTEDEARITNPRA